MRRELRCVSQNEVIHSSPLSSDPRSQKKNFSLVSLVSQAVPAEKIEGQVSAGPSVRREDVPLHEDVRWLAASLGRVIRRLEGEAAFETIEALRKACRARRLGAPNARSLDELLAQVEALPLERSAVTARAFTLFFLLINTAEQVHR